MHDLPVCYMVPIVWIQTTKYFLGHTKVIKHFFLCIIWKHGYQYSPMYVLTPLVVLQLLWWLLQLDKVRKNPWTKQTWLSLYWEMTLAYKCECMFAHIKAGTILWCITFQCVYQYDKLSINVLIYQYIDISLFINQ